MARTVLVTGGAGYVGSHACKALALAGCHPVVFDDLSNGHEWAVQWGPLEQGNILDRDRLDQVMSVYQPSAVMHFAAFMASGSKWVSGLWYSPISPPGSAPAALK